MSEELESFKIEFAKGLASSDYTFRCTYSRIEDCLQGIAINNLLPSKTKFKIFKIVGTESLMVQADNSFIIDYMILQNGTDFELYELTISKYNEFEEKLSHFP